MGGHISTLSQVTAEDNRITNVAQNHIQKCRLSYIALSIHLVPTLLQGTSWKVVVVFFFLVTIIEMFFSILNKNVNLTEKMTGNVYFQEKYIQGAICLKAS